MLADAPALRAKMRAPEVRVEVELARAARGTATAWGCDLGYDYVKLNADYTSLIVQTADGGLAKDDRLTNYSPSFKRKLIVEALSYISRFSGTRCVIKFGGSALIEAGARAGVLRRHQAAALGRPAADRRPRRLGRDHAHAREAGPPPAEFVEGVRVTSPSDSRSSTWRSAAINSHLVTLLNLDGAHALGISGKDGALLRAKKRPSPGGP